MRTTNRIRTRQVVGLIAVAILATIASVASPAVAQDYPPSPIIVIDQPLVSEGNIVTITGSGFLPNSFVCLCILQGPDGFLDAVALTSFSGAERFPPFPEVVTLASSPKPVQLASAGLAAQTQQEKAIATCLALGGTIIGSTTSDADGNWSFEWDTSGFPPGDYAIAANDGTNTATVNVMVTPPVGPTPTTVPGPVVPGLPQTGGFAGGPLRVGVVLLTLGGLVLLAVRSRRPTAHAQSRR